LSCHGKSLALTYNVGASGGRFITTDFVTEEETDKLINGE